MAHVLGLLLMTLLVCIKFQQDLIVCLIAHVLGLLLMKLLVCIKFQQDVIVCGIAHVLGLLLMKLLVCQVSARCNRLSDCNFQVFNPWRPLS